MLNKKAQVGETVTWIVATVIIVVILLFFLFGAVALAETKSVKKFRPSLISESSYQGDDLFLKKNVFTYVSITKDNSRKRMETYLVKKELEGDFLYSYNETRKEVILNLNELA
jgi:hypothetical protein